MEKRFEGKVALITGGGSGIGQATAIAFAAQGAKVIVSDIKENETVVKILAEGGDACFFPTDVSIAVECAQLIKNATDTYGKIDIAFNNAGILGEVNPIADMSIEGFNKVINVNLNGVFYCMKFEIEQMLKQGRGVIVNMASILGAVGFSSFGGYVAAKHGVVGLTQNAALEYSSKGVRINCVAPGFIDTPLLNLMDEQAKEVLASKHPIGRLGTSEEVAALVLWLSSDEASFVTGAYYPIDGGYLTN